MDEVDRWFGAQAERERRVVHLEDALLGNRFAAYFRHRLRFFFARYAIASVLSLVKVLVIHRIFGPTGFVILVGFIAVVGVLSMAWWGALEVLRTRVRRLYRFESPRLVSREIARWVFGSLVFAILVAVVVFAVLIVDAIGTGSVGPVEAAAAAILIRGAFDLPVRAYHAGAYAVRRVYRPLPSIFALEAFSLAAIFGLLPLLGVYAVAVAELVVAFGFAAVSAYYTARTHRLLGFHAGRLVVSWIRASLRLAFRVGQADAPTRPGRFGTSGMRRRSGSGRRPTRLTWLDDVLATAREIAPPALAGLLMSADSLVVLAIVGAARNSPEGPSLVLLFTAISPTVRAGFEWSQLIYFDLKRLEAPLFSNLRRRLDRGTLRLALVLGFTFSGVGLVVASAFIGLRDVWLGALVPFLVGASLLGLAEMEAFAAGAYRRVLLGGSVFLAGLATLPWLTSAMLDPIVVLAIMTLLAVSVLHLSSRLLIAGPPDADVLLPTAWVARLTASSKPVIVGATRVRPAGSGGARRYGRPSPEVIAGRAWHAYQLARRLAARAGPAGGVTCIFPDVVAWFQPADGRRKIDRHRILVQSAGQVMDMRESASQDGRGAVAVVGAWGLFRDDVGPRADGPGRRSDNPRPVEFGAPTPQTPSATHSIPAAASVPAQGATVWREPTLAELAARFRRLFPQGIVFDTEAPATADLRELESGERRLILWEAIRYARELSLGRGQGRFEVTCWYPDGSVRLVFLANRSANAGLRAGWRRFLRDANLLAASGGGLTGRGTLVASARGREPTALAATAATQLGTGSD